MQASLVLMANRSGVPGLWPAGGAALSPEGALVATSLVLIFGGSDPACGAGGVSGLESSCKADCLVLIRLCFIRSPGDGPALAPPSLAETASRVLIRGRSRGDGSRGECCSPGAAGDGGSAGISCVGGSAVVRSSPSVSRPLADFFFFRRASTPRRA